MARLGAVGWKKTTIVLKVGGFEMMFSHEIRGPCGCFFSFDFVIETGKIKEKTTYTVVLVFC